MTPRNHLIGRRAPAVYIAATCAARPEARYHFRLPCPPESVGGAISDRRMKRWAEGAYFATLDAMRTGRVDEEQAVTLGKLLLETTTRSARSALEHLGRIIDAVVRNAGQALLPPPPPTPLDSLVATATVTLATEWDDLVERLVWPLAWLQTRGYVARQGLDFRWQRLGGIIPAASSSPRTALLNVYYTVR